MALGSWRFLLALAVAWSHLWADMLQGPAAFAVWGFYVISGHLMATVLRDRYGFSPAGLRAYAANRALRILPGYAVAALAGALALAVLVPRGIDVQALNPSFAWPQTWRDWGANLTLLPAFYGGRLFVPVAGALMIEVAAYLLMPLMARHASAAWLAAVLSLTLNVHVGLGLEQFAQRYASFHTAFFAFSVGALVCHHREALARWRAPRASAALWLLHALSWWMHHRWPWTWGLYSATLLSAWLLLSFVDRPASRLDRWLGELSYPVYLLHTVCGAFLFGLFGQQRSLGFASAAVALTLLASAAMVLGVDRPLLRWKRPPLRSGSPPA